MICPCNTGDHTATQHDSQERLYRSINRGGTPMTETPGKKLVGYLNVQTGAMRDVTPDPFAPETQRLACTHNVNGEFEGLDACDKEATVMLLWRGWDGQRKTDYRCQDQVELALLVDTIEANPAAGLTVYQLVDVTDAATQERVVEIRVDRGMDEPSELITWAPIV